jgi:hypothetical protein
MTFVESVDVLQLLGRFRYVFGDHARRPVHFAVQDLILFCTAPAILALVSLLPTEHTPSEKYVCSMDVTAGAISMRNSKMAP